MQWILKRCGLAGILLVLIAMLCTMPTYAEEPVQERNEQVEETIILNTREQKEVQVQREPSTILWPPSIDRHNRGASTRGYVTFSKLYILHGSLRLYR